MDLTRALRARIAPGCVVGKHEYARYEGFPPPLPGAICITNRIRPRSTGHALMRDRAALLRRAGVVVVAQDGGAAEVPCGLVGFDADAPPPEHVRTAFGAREAEPEFLPAVGGPAWRCGDVVLRPVPVPTEAAWVAQTMDTLQVEGMRLARPVRSTDGRWVVSGWTAVRHLAGQNEPRYDDVIAASLRLHAAMSSVSRPGFLDDRQDVFALADRAAAGEAEVSLPPDRGGRLFDELVPARRELRLPEQVVHGDLFGKVLFAGAAPPAIVDLAVFWRPVEWAAAVVVIDAVAWGGADRRLPDRWSHLREWPQVLLRALLFRVAVNALHPAATEESLEGLRGAAGVVSQHLAQPAHAR